MWSYYIIIIIMDIILHFRRSRRYVSHETRYDTVQLVHYYV